jgi:hypothetical protein
MPVRPAPFAALAVLVSAVLVACTGTEPTGPRLRQSLRTSFDATTCGNDVSSPTITSFSATPSVLSPADKQMVPVTLHWGAVDDCGPPTCTVTSIESNEKGKRNGAPPDAVMTSGTTLNLRATKGNVYTITLTCQDAAGNASTATTTVTVPKESKACAHDDHGQGDDKNGDVDMEHKCKTGGGDDDDRG